MTEYRIISRTETERGENIVVSLTLLPTAAGAMQSVVLPALSEAEAAGLAVRDIVTLPVTKVVA